MTVEKIVSDIGPARSKVLPEVEVWASRMSELARLKLDGPIKASVWAYRLNETECLSIDLVGQSGGDMSVTISTGVHRTNYSFNDLEATCFEVPDMTEALLMASIFLRHAGAQVSFSAGA